MFRRCRDFASSSEASNLSSGLEGFSPGGLSAWASGSLVAEGVGSFFVVCSRLSRSSLPNRPKAHGLGYPV